MFFLFVKHVFLHKNIYFRASWNHVVLYSWLRAISLQRYSVTVPYGEYFCLRQKGKLFWASCNFVTALQCDSSVWRVFLFASKGKLFWALDISLQRYSVTVPF